MSDSRKNIQRTILGVCLFMACMLGLLINKQLTKPEYTAEQLREVGVFIFEPPRIVKPFELQSHKGEVFTRDNFEGKWSLVFFGFTFCPDICPATMALLNQAMDKIDDPNILATTQVVMVSVDPARDTVEQLAQYMPYFNKDFIGVTGEFLTIHALATNLNAAFQKVPGGGEHYTVDHSAYIFLVNPKGDYHAFMKPPFSAQSIADHYQAVRALFKH